MWNAGLNESQAQIKIAGRNINNLRWTDYTTLMAESEEELKSFLMMVKEESEKAVLKLNIQKTKVVASWSNTSYQLCCCCCLVTSACLTLCDPMDHALPGSSVQGILQARIMEWVAIFFSNDKVRSEWSEWSEVTQLCPTLCDPMDCSLPGSSVHGIFQARGLEWVAISFSHISYKGEKWKWWQILFSKAPESLCMVIGAMKVKILSPWKESNAKPRLSIKKQRYHFANKGLYSQIYGFFQ